LVDHARILARPATGVTSLLLPGTEIAGYKSGVKRAAAVTLIFLGACVSMRPPAPDVGFVSPRLGALEGRTLAVLPFNNTSGFLGADYLVTDEFNLRLGMTNRFRMIERIRVKELYREQDFDPARVEETTAARAGRMLGAQAVILGTVTKYLSANRPPEVPLDAFPVLMPASTQEEAALAIVVNTVAALAAFVSRRQPIAEVGVTVRLVATETGEILWQARSAYRGDDEVLTKRQPRNEWDRLRKDVVLLTGVLASDMVETLTRDWPGGDTVGTEGGKR
jgi:TolB-like protein